MPQPLTQGSSRKAPAVLSVAEQDELMKFLIAKLPHKSRDNIKSLLKNDQVLVDGQPTRQFNHPLAPGMTVQVNWERQPEAKALRGLTILYEDEHLIVIDKHAGMLSVAPDNEPTALTAYTMLSQHVKIEDPDAKIFIVHRLDRDTSGLMMYAKDVETKTALQADWAEAVTERTYIALVEGQMKEESGTLESYLWEGNNMKVYTTQDPERGQLAITHFWTLKTNAEYSLVKLELETGRKNQIRVQLAEIGHPVVGDKKYGATNNPIARLGLHAAVLAFRHPATGKTMRFETNTPRKFLRLV